MKIVADKDIPFVLHYFSQENLTLKPGREITRKDLIDVDVLLVRSVMKVNAELLESTPVKFVGTVTTGIDHLDIQWLESADIIWRSAAGYNAVPVSDYVIAVIAALYPQTKPARVGVIGVGHIGSHVAERLKRLDCEVLLSDPLRAENEAEFSSVALSEFNNADVITLHVPLTLGGSYPTHHLINDKFFKSLKKETVIINTGRGEAIDVSAANTYMRNIHACFDVWNNEPNINLKILYAAEIATPHIAGYSVQCRYRGTAMIYQELCDLGFIKPGGIEFPVPPKLELAFNNQVLSWQEVVLSIFNPCAVTDKMKELLLKQPEKCATLFDELRKSYIGEGIKRHEFSSTHIKKIKLSEQDRYFLTQLGIQISE